MAAVLIYVRGGIAYVENDAAEPLVEIRDRDNGDATFTRREISMANRALASLGIDSGLPEAPELATPEAAYPGPYEVDGNDIFGAPSRRPGGGIDRPRLATVHEPHTAPESLIGTRKLLAASFELREALAVAERLLADALETHIYSQDDERPDNCEYTAGLEQMRKALAVSGAPVETLDEVTA